MNTTIESAKDEVAKKYKSLRTRLSFDKWRNIATNDSRYHAFVEQAMELYHFSKCQEADKVLNPLNYDEACVLVASFKSQLETKDKEIGKYIGEIEMLKVKLLGLQAEEAENSLLKSQLQGAKVKIENLEKYKDFYNNIQKHII